MTKKIKVNKNLDEYACVKCGIVGKCKSDGKHINCTDCGAAYPLPKG